jgi:hypothetical protein
MSSSPSVPSFFRATPNTRAKRTSPKMFIPSISEGMGVCRSQEGEGSPQGSADLGGVGLASETLCPE